MVDPIVEKTVMKFDAPSLDSLETPCGRSSFWHRLRCWLKHALGLNADSLQEALEEAIEAHNDEALAPLADAEKVMLHNVLHFRDIKVSDIMTPRADIAAVPHDVMLPALKAHIIEQRHTRIPVYEDTLDKMLGFLHVKDLLPVLGQDTAFDLHAVLRPLLFVPPSMRLIDLLVKMRQARAFPSSCWKKSWVWRWRTRRAISIRWAG